MGIPRQQILERLRAGVERWNSPGQPPDVDYPLDFRTLFPDKAVDLPGLKGGLIFPGQVIFDGLRFPAGFSFQDVNFQSGASFRGSTFQGDVSFSNTTFGGPVTFELSRFRGQAHFRTRFSGHAHFIATRFYRDAFFDSSVFDRDTKAILLRCVFRGEASFIEVTFHGSASFARSRFCLGAQFTKVTAIGSVTFNRAKFDARAEFGNVALSNAHFEGARFRQDADFSSSDENRVLSDTVFAGARFEGPARFWKRRFRGITVFRGVHFQEAPEFFNAALPHEADFEQTTYGPITAENASLAAPAYRTLKLAMSELQHHRAEALFFSKEMRARRYIEGNALQRGLFATYGAFSDFGQSVIRPGIGLFITLALFFVVYVIGIEAPRVVECLAADSCKLVLDGGRARAFLVLSFAGLIPFFEFAKQAVASASQILLNSDRPPLWLPVVELLENVASTLFLFLLGLAVRNLFRLR